MQHQDVKEQNRMSVLNKLSFIKLDFSVPQSQTANPILNCGNVDLVDLSAETGCGMACDSFETKSPHRQVSLERR